MNGFRAWSLKAVVLVMAMLAAIGGWEIYKGTVKLTREAGAQNQNGDGDLIQLVEQVNEIHRVVVGGQDGFPVLARLHFKCYQVTPGGPALNQPVEVFDQFHKPPDGEKLTLRAVHTLCTPALKTIPTASSHR